MMRLLSSLLAAPALVLALLGVCLGAGVASAQVPYDMSYRGRLTDAVGAPPTALIAIPAIHPEFAAIGGPTAAGPYWSAVSVDDPEAVADPNQAYGAFAPGFGPHLNPAWGVAGGCGTFGPFGAPVCPFHKSELYDIAARAVRIGSCAP